MKKACLVVIIIIAVIIAFSILSGIYYYKGLAAPSAMEQGKKNFTVEEGWGVAEIAKNLKDDGYIKSELVFKIYVFFSGEKSHLQAGIFEISPSMDTPEIVSVLAIAQEKQVELKIIEGQRIEEVARYLSDQGIKGDLVERAKAGNFKANYDFLKKLPDSTSLEGFLFPDTYKINMNSTVDDLIKKMLDNFAEKLKELPAPTNPVFNNISDLVTLASIVEREATQSQIERRRIAGVYINRLVAGTYLQADPTTQYSKDSQNYKITKDKNSFKFWQAITQSDYETVDGGYNTYKVKGLPPGPICGPSFGSLTAAFNPERNDYFYFFHTQNGSIIFSKTAAEHEAKLKEQ